jgi:hypothetical protein
MRPPARKTTDFEKVVTGDFIMGIIEKVEYDENHIFKGFDGKADKTSPAIRFVFKLDGYEYPHRSRWMNFNVGEKANLYKKYISKLINDAKPDMDFDMDVFTNMKIKTIWEDNGDFQNLESIYPNGPRLTVQEGGPVDEPPPPHTDEDDFVPEGEYDDDPPM